MVARTYKPVKRKDMEDELRKSGAGVSTKLPRSLWATEHSVREWGFISEMFLLWQWAKNVDK